MNDVGVVSAVWNQIWNVALVQAHLQHYTEPSADALPATSNLTSNTVLPLSSGTFTHNSAGVPIIVVCTKADLIDEGSDLVGAGASGMGAMVKGKGGEWEEQTDGIMQVLRTICLKCKSSILIRVTIPQTRMSRWCRPVLYDTSAKYPQRASAVYTTSLVHASRTVSWSGRWNGSIRTDTKSVCIPSQTEHARP